jgi:hypothetical protein
MHLGLEQLKKLKILKMIQKKIGRRLIPCCPDALGAE